MLKRWSYCLRYQVGRRMFTLPAWKAFPLPHFMQYKYSYSVNFCQCCRNALSICCHLLPRSCFFFLGSCSSLHLWCSHGNAACTIRRYLILCCEKILLAKLQEFKDKNSGRLSKAIKLLLFGQIDCYLGKNKQHNPQHTKLKCVIDDIPTYYFQFFLLL